MTQDDQCLADQIRAACEEVGTTQFAALSGLTERTIYNLLAGDSDPRRRTRQGVLRALEHVASQRNGEASNGAE